RTAAAAIEATLPRGPATAVASDTKQPPMPPMPPLPPPPLPVFPAAVPPAPRPPSRFFPAAVPPAPSGATPPVPPSMAPVPLPPNVPFVGGEDDEFEGEVPQIDFAGLTMRISQAMGSGALTAESMQAKLSAIGIGSVFSLSTAGAVVIN